MTPLQSSSSEVDLLPLQSRAMKFSFLARSARRYRYREDATVVDLHQLTRDRTTTRFSQQYQCAEKATHQVFRDYGALHLT